MLKNITPINFADNKVFKIDDFKIKKIIIEYLINDINNLFIQEKNINEENILKNIKSKNYKAIYLPTGETYILLLKLIDNIYYTLLIKNNFNLNVNTINYNNLEIHHLDLIFPKKYFNGTILNGYITKDNDKCSLNIYDIVYYEGNLINSNLDEKKNLIKSILVDINTKYFNYNIVNYIEISELVDDKINNGIIFIPFINDLKYVIKKKTKIIKEYSNLYMKKLNTDVFNLYCLNDDYQKQKIGIAHIPNIKTSLEFNKYDDELKVKCWFNNKFSKWIPFEILNDIDENITNYNQIIKQIKKI